MPANQFGIDVGEILQTRNQLALQGHQLRGLQRAETTQNTLATYLPKVLGGDKNAVAEASAESPDAGLQLMDIASKMTAAQREQFKTTLELGGQIAGAMLNVPDAELPQAVMQWAVPKAKELGIDVADIERVAQSGNPAQLRQLLTQKQQSAMSAADQLAKADRDRTFTAGREDATRAQSNADRTFQAGREDATAANADRDAARAIQSRQADATMTIAQQNAAIAAEKAQREREDAVRTRSGAAASYDTALATLDRLEKHPGLNDAIGWKNPLKGNPLGAGALPGTDRANFEAYLDTFKAQTFIPMIQQMRGLGQLSNAEGLKVTEAVGALNINMSETAFKESIKVIRDTLKAARARQGAANEQPPSIVDDLETIIDFNDLQ